MLTSEQSVHVKMALARGNMREIQPLTHIFEPESDQEPDEQISLLCMEISGKQMYSIRMLSASFV